MALYVLAPAVDLTRGYRPEIDGTTRWIDEDFRHIKGNYLRLQRKSKTNRIDYGPA